MRDDRDAVTVDLFGQPIIRKGQSIVRPTAEGARDQALGSVLENAGDTWTAFALRRLRDFAAHKVQTGVPEFIGEEFRVWYCANLSWPLPHHHNAWGALTRTASAQGWLRATGRMASMNTTKSHARKSPTWILNKTGDDTKCDVTLIRWS